MSIDDQHCQCSSPAEKHGHSHLVLPFGHWVSCSKELHLQCRGPWEQYPQFPLPSSFLFTPTRGGFPARLCMEQELSLSSDESDGVDKSNAHRSGDLAKHSQKDSLVLVFFFC